MSDTDLDQHTNVSPDQPDSAWCDNGIIFINFNQPTSLENVTAMERRCLQLLAEHNLTLAPFVIYYTNNSGEKTRLKVSEIGKVYSKQLMNSVSFIVMVGAQGLDNKLLQLTNKLFMGGRMVGSSRLLRRSQKTGRTLQKRQLVDNGTPSRRELDSRLRVGYRLNDVVFEVAGRRPS